MQFGKLIEKRQSHVMALPYFRALNPQIFQVGLANFLLSVNPPGA
jgi:hypothetical protein